VSYTATESLKSKLKFSSKSAKIPFKTKASKKSNVKGSSKSKMQFSLKLAEIPCETEVVQEKRLGV